jgi:hypothetical protein
LSRVNRLHVFKLCSRSQISEQSLFQCIMSVLWVIIILWHADPLLGNEHEISSYTTATSR